jgi:nitroreductase
MQYNLSEITELIRSRRSIPPEYFSTRKIHKEQIELLLNNAIWAPNHGMTQPWRFIVINGEKKRQLRGVAEMAYTEGKSSADINLGKLQKMLERISSANVVLAVVMQRDPAEKVPEWEEVAAIGGAMQNLHLTAHAYGLAGFWATPQIIQSPLIESFLELSPGQKCLGLFYLGYPKEAEVKSHRKPIEYCSNWFWDE